MRDMRALQLVPVAAASCGDGCRLQRRLPSESRLVDIPAGCSCVGLVPVQNALPSCCMPVHVRGLAHKIAAVWAIIYQGKMFEFAFEACTYMQRNPE